MKTRTAGLSILAGGLAFVGSAAATELLQNGSFEDGPGVGWVGDFGTYSYSAAYFAGPPIPASENPGAVYSWRHGISASDFSGPLTQTVGLAAGADDADIDASHGVYTFSAWMASYTQNPERPYVTLQFLDAANNPLSGVIALDRTSGLNFTGFADGATTFDRTTHEHYWAKYVSSGSIPPGARSARVGVSRSPNAGLSGRPDTYTDLVKLDVTTTGAVPPSFVSATPSGPNARPDAVVTVVLQDGTTQVDPSQVQMTFDGAAVTPGVQRNGVNTTITYDPPGLLESESAHAVQVIAADNAPQRNRLTNDFTFSVLRYQNIELPTPLYLETFDTTAEGSLPAGWSGVSYSAVPDANIDLGDLNSAVYANWTVVDSARFRSTLLGYSNHVPTDDYQRVLTPNPANVVNGEVVENLAQDKICFADSGYRDGESQVMYLYSRDFDLTGHGKIYLVFYSLWEQNQDSIASVEYSVDEGATWLPLLYLLDQSAVTRDQDGKIDPVATFGAMRPEVATYIDPADQMLKGGYYGAFIGVGSERWSELGPFISPRVNDDPVESKRVEVLPLPAADNQSKVRLRFAHAGTDSWYFGIDNVGLYAANTPPVADASATETTVISGNYSNAVVILDGSRSSDPDQDPLTFSWFADDSQAAVATGAMASIVLDVGVHQVVLVVNDGTSTASAPIEIHVVTPGEAIDALIALINQSNIPRQTQRPLVATLKAAIASFDRGNDESGVNQLHAFQNKVAAQLSSTSPVLAAQLIAEAQKIIDAVAGP